MCEHGEMGCPNCGNGTDSIIYSTSGYASVAYNVYGDGSPGERIETGEVEDDGSDGEFYCQDCGDTFSECVERDTENCDCDECEPPPPADPDELVTLVKRTNELKSWPIDVPPELQLLFSRRSIKVLPLRYERAEQVQEWAEDNALWPDEVFIRNDPPSDRLLSMRVPEPMKEAA